MKYISLFGFLALVALVSFSGASFAPGEWHAGLVKPAWNPPNWLFGPVWSVLYVMIAVAGWLVWRAEGMQAALGVWVLQLAANGLWSFLFFGLQRPDLGLIDIGVLLVLITTFILLARRVSIAAAALFVPYWLWVAFATALNFEIWRLNG